MTTPGPGAVTAWRSHPARGLGRFSGSCGGLFRWWNVLSMYPSRPEHQNRDAEVFLKKDGETVTVYYIFGEKRLHF